MRCLLVLLFSLFCMCAYGDTYKVTKIVVPGHESVWAEFRQGKNFRTEQLGADNVPQDVVIVNSKNGLTYRLDPARHEYVEQQAQSEGLIWSLASWITRPPRVRESGKTVHVYFETIDTGERRTFFGQSAKHVIERFRRVAEPGACSKNYESESDAWVIPDPELGNRNTSGAYLTSFPLPREICRDTVITHSQSQIRGLKVLEIRSQVTIEVVHLSYAPLDSSIFQVPQGYKEVDRLEEDSKASWWDEVRMEWGVLERAFDSWFE